jgi:phosphoglycerate dehydrogenase-like enzyme
VLWTPAAGDRVVVVGLGLGGLGHLAVRFAVAMGFETVWLSPEVERTSVRRDEPRPRPRVGLVIRCYDSLRAPSR